MLLRFLDTATEHLPALQIHQPLDSRLVVVDLNKTPDHDRGKYLYPQGRLMPTILCLVDISYPLRSSWGQD